MAAEAEKVKLYGLFASPYSKTVEIALKMKGVEYEYFEEDVYYNNKSADLLKYNPVHKKVPVLIHNGKPIAESMIIIEYIDETWKSGPAILPADPYERAMARFCADFIPACLLSLFLASWTSDEDKSKKAAEEGLEKLRALEKQLGNKKFFGGETVGYLDLAAIFFSHWMGVLQEVTGKELVKDDDFPLLSKWKREVLDCSIIKETLPPKDKLAAFMKDNTALYISSADDYLEVKT